VTAKDIPNVISVLRMVLVIPIVFLLLKDFFGWALLLFTLAGISDALDGYLANRYNWRSRLGSILDPLADKLLLISSFVALTWLGLIPLWLTTAVIARDLIIVAGGVAFHYLIGKFEMEPTFISKVNTFLQIVLVLAVVFSYGVINLGEASLNMLFYGVFLTSIVSGMHYTFYWAKRSISHRTPDP